MVNYVLYSSPLSANGRKVLAYAQYRQFACDVIDVNVYQGEGQRDVFLALNPLGKIPVLKKDNFVLTESNAILQFIDKGNGNSKEQKALIASWLFFEAAHFQPAMSEVMGQQVGHRIVPQYVAEPKSACNWSGDTMTQILSHVENQLKNNLFLVGELSIADFSLAGMMTYARFCQFPLERYPAIRRWYESIEALTAWQATKTKLWEN